MSIETYLANAIKTAVEIIDDFAHPDNTLFGYHDRYAERVSDLNAAAGTNILQGTAVPAGEVWVIQSIRGVNVNSIPTLVELRVQSATIMAVLEIATPAAANESVLWSGAIFIKEADRTSARFEGCVLNDDLYLDIWGYKMKV